MMTRNCYDGSANVVQVASFIVQCLDGMDRLDMLNLKDTDNIDLLISIALALDFLKDGAIISDTTMIKQFWSVFCDALMENRTSPHPLLSAVGDNVGGSSIDQSPWINLCVYLVRTVVALYDLADIMKRQVLELDPWHRECVERLLGMLDDEFMHKLNEFTTSSPPSTSIERRHAELNQLSVTEKTTQSKSSRRIVPMCSLASLNSPPATIGVPGRTDWKRSIASMDTAEVNTLTAKKQPSFSSKKVRLMSHSTERILADVSKFLDGTGSKTSIAHGDERDEQEQLFSRATNSSSAFYFSATAGHNVSGGKVLSAAEGESSERRLYRRKFALSR